MGEGGCNLENSRIEKNKGPGIKVGPINRVKIMKNEIRQNSIGIESNKILLLVVSGDPFILNNLIEKNYGNGITTSVFDNLRCDGKIRNNDILGNLENGIDTSGNTNYTRVELLIKD